MKKFIIGGIVVAIIVALAFLSWDYAQEKKAETKGEDEVLAKCPAAFVQKNVADEALNRFVRGGIDAGTPQKSRDKLLSAAGHDAAYLRFLAETFGVKPPKASEMLTEGGACLSEAGRQVHHDLRVVMKASGVEFAQAPADAYNTGMSSGKAVVSRKAGISGDRKALEFTLADGSKAVVLVRCGNPVFPDKPDIPDGPTDEDPPKCPPGMVGKPPVCKDTPGEDPYRQGNAEDGGGKNANKGPGDKTKDPKKPGPDDRVNPPKPEPEPPGPTPTPTPDPTTPPEPEPEAPEPDDPETGCVPIPGVEDCK